MYLSCKHIFLRLLPFLLLSTLWFDIWTYRILTIFIFDCLVQLLLLLLLQFAVLFNSCCKWREKNISGISHVLHELQSSFFIWWSFSTCYTGSKRHVIFQILPAISLRFLGTFALHAKSLAFFVVSVCAAKVALFLCGFIFYCFVLLLVVLRCCFFSLCFGLPRARYEVPTSI